jgi:hypothetical protein
MPFRGKKEKSGMPLFAQPKKQHAAWAQALYSHIHPPAFNQPLQLHLRPVCLVRAIGASPAIQSTA